MRNLIYLFTFLILTSCEYHREQKIPKELKTVLKDNCCLPATYCAKVYEIQNESQLKEWNKNIFCEGSDGTKLQSWVSYSKLPKKEQKFISENIKYWNENNYQCDIFKTIDVEKIYFAACFTENINPANNEIRTFYHSIYLLNQDKTLFIDIQYIH